MNTRFTAAASVLVISLASCDLHKDPVGLLTPGQISTDPTLNSFKVSVTSSYQMLASTLSLLGEWRWDFCIVFFFSSRRRHTRLTCDWSSDVCSSELDGRIVAKDVEGAQARPAAVPTG